MAIAMQERTITETTLQPTHHTKPSRIYVPGNISEQSDVSGYLFTKKFQRLSKSAPSQFSRFEFETAERYAYADTLAQLVSDNAGGPTLGTNSITISIASTPASAKSETDYIWLYFGRSHRVKLNAYNGQFPAGYTLTYDLNDIADWLEDHISTDAWDEIGLATDSTDGIKISHIKIVHSSQTILDWDCNLWLDGSKREEYTKLVFTAKILESKLNAIANNWVPQIHWAAREIGKSDGSKYGSTGAWCSEFASWCIRKALFDTPSGNIGSQDMEDYYASIGRKYTYDQLINGDYVLVAGDYIRFEWSDGGHHSGIFIEYLTDAANPSDDTTIRTIEGNASSTVKVASRQFRDILSVGNNQ